MTATDTAVVRLVEVTKRYAEHPDEPPALDGITLEVGAGEVFGVIGESGAGKSTLLRLLAGLEKPDSGSVAVRDLPVPALGRRALRELRRGIGVVFQSVDLLSNRTVRQNVALPLQLARRRDAPTSRAEERHRVDEILEFVGLSHRADHFPAQLSGGEQQRVGLARALVTRPALLLCDEPTSSLDTTTTSEVLRVLVNARDRLGTTVVVITHDLDVVKAICDRAAFLERGTLRELFEVAKSDYRSLPTYYEQVRQELMG
ncbi:ATP-binding cassette domain-containing protein [Microbacterium betulae]|uniref:ATP-binding cassette domain-containing protein n=1 Tax=Microbacterium betulae TaxID=2981139 RepID=A0AA97FIU5_9MICO|nr:ATP-binding cassette domain-containing protein [Microbacterium sp. AB]WOF23508.1 ATP-binding cassette domain-containing protein [Microbacterium sp. AB]